MKGDLHRWAATELAQAAAAAQGLGEGASARLAATGRQAAMQLSDAANKQAAHIPRHGSRDALCRIVDR